METKTTSKASDSPLNAMKYQLICLFELTSDISVIGRSSILVILVKLTISIEREICVFRFLRNVLSYTEGDQYSTISSIWPSTLSKHRIIHFGISCWVQKLNYADLPVSLELVPVEPRMAPPLTSMSLTLYTVSGCGTELSMVRRKIPKSDSEGRYVRNPLNGCRTSDFLANSTASLFNKNE